MASSSFKGFIIGMLLVGLFAFALISSGIIIGDKNNGQSIGDIPTISKFRTDIQVNLSEAYNTANSSETSFGSSPISLTSIVFVDALGGIWKTLKSIPLAIWNLIMSLVSGSIAPASEYGVVFGVIGAIIIITIIFGVWKMISTGDGG